MACCIARLASLTLSNHVCQCRRRVVIDSDVLALRCSFYSLTAPASLRDIRLLCNTLQGGLLIPSFQPVEIAVGDALHVTRWMSCQMLRGGNTSYS